MRAIPAVVLALILGSADMLADNWPQWRGSKGTGVADEATLPTSWDNQSNVAWRVPVAGAGVSTPIIWGDRVFVTSQQGRGVLQPGTHPTLARGEESVHERMLEDAGKGSGGAVTFVVEAFQRSDGRRLWEHKLASEGPLPEVHGKHNLASPSPVTDGERVYAWFGTGQLVALDMNGRPVWQRHMGREYSPFEINWGHSSSPTVVGDLLILLCDHDPASYLLALDARSGKERWKVDRERGLNSYSTPFLVETPSRRELIVNSSRRVDAYDPATGKHLWFTGEPNRFPIPVPTFEGGTIYLSRGYRSGPYMAIRPGGTGDVSDTHVTWKVGAGAPYVSSLVLYQGLIYMANDAGVITAVDAGTGARVWQERIGGVFTASPVAGDGKVFIFSESGETIVLAAGREPRIAARNRLDGRVTASPAIADGQIFIRTDDHLYCVGSRAATRRSSAP